MTEYSEITPKMLDWAINGVPVYINYSRARANGDTYYATIHDYGRFGVVPVAVVRVPAVDLLKNDDPTQHASVLAKLKEYNGH